VWAHCLPTGIRNAAIERHQHRFDRIDSVGLLDPELSGIPDLGDAIGIGSENGNEWEFIKSRSHEVSRNGYARKRGALDAYVADRVTSGRSRHHHIGLRPHFFEYLEETKPSGIERDLWRVYLGTRRDRSSRPQEGSRRRITRYVESRWGNLPWQDAEFRCVDPFAQPDS
jgi:hypothetical protein